MLQIYNFFLNDKGFRTKIYFSQALLLVFAWRMRDYGLSLQYLFLIRSSYGKKEVDWNGDVFDGIKC